VDQGSIALLNGLHVNISRRGGAAKVFQGIHGLLQILLSLSLGFLGTADLPGLRLPRDLKLLHAGVGGSQGFIQVGKLLHLNCASPALLLKFLSGALQVALDLGEGDLCFPNPVLKMRQVANGLAMRIQGPFHCSIPGLEVLDSPLSSTSSGDDLGEEGDDGLQYVQPLGEILQIAKTSHGSVKGTKIENTRK
jgi:hypothetical protein